MNSSREACCQTLGPADFASSVRQFAFDAHRILNDPFATAHDLVELSTRIDALWRRCPAPRSASIEQWLRSAGAVVRTQDLWPEVRVGS
jgi:hypothetical protein